jgi:hypothetical protein
MVPTLFQSDRVFNVFGVAFRSAHGGGKAAGQLIHEFMGTHFGSRSVRISCRQTLPALAMLSGWRWRPSVLGNCVASYDDSSIGEVEASILDAEERLTPEFYEDLGGRDALDKVRRERSYDSSVLKFRMLLGQHAQNLKVGPNPGDFVSRTLAWAWKPMVILTSKECKALSPLGKHLYKEQRKVREKRSAVVSRARHQFENGAFDAPIVAFSGRCRLPGGGRPIGHISSAEALYNYFFHHFVELQGRVPAALLRAQAITFLTAAAGEGDPDPLPPDWTKAWLANWLGWVG